jgi:uncharacterized protein
MPAPVRSAHCAVALFMLAASIVTAGAQQAAPPAAPQAPAAAPTPPKPAAAADAVPAPPSAAALAAADQLLIAMGVKDSIRRTVPAMMAEFEKNLSTTRPEIRNSLRETLVAIKPQFDQSAEQTYSKAEVLLALAMSEKELEDVAAFFTSPTGKKYLAIEPVFLQRLQDVLVPWRDELSTDIVTKAREEMKKKGVDF